MLTHWIQDQRHIINSIGLTSGDGQTALWAVRENSGGEIWRLRNNDQFPSFCKFKLILRLKIFVL